MKILVINAGSSSLKYQLIDMENENVLAKGICELGEWTHTVAVMSSNYVQRGETAIASKWARAEMAVRNGVDLVIELPTLWSTSYAQRFAEGAVSLLDSLGCVDMLSFGSESGNTAVGVGAAGAVVLTCIVVFVFVTSNLIPKNQDIEL